MEIENLSLSRTAQRRRDALQRKSKKGLLGICEKTMRFWTICTHLRTYVTYCYKSYSAFDVCHIA